MAGDNVAEKEFDKRRDIDDVVKSGGRVHGILSGSGMDNVYRNMPKKDSAWGKLMEKHEKKRKKSKSRASSRVS